MKNIFINLFTISSFLVSLLGGALDDSDGNGLFHISDGESSEGRIFSETLAAEGLAGLHNDKGRVSVLDEFGFLLGGFTSSSVNLGLDFVELASNVGSVAVQNWSVSVLDLSWVVHDDDLSEESLDFSWGIVLGVSSNVSSLDVLD